jgi:predicted GTPase
LRPEAAIDEVKKDEGASVPDEGCHGAAAHGDRDRFVIFESLAREAGADRVAREAAELRERLGEGRFFVACVGQFKRGKSTLINALIGRPMLPTGVVPVTSVVTVLRDGVASGARVRFSDGRELEIRVDALEQYVNEACNPGNGKNVAAVEITVPNRLLATGMCLVDTPGLGSVLAANTATTRAFVPHIDAALVVLGSDPPISGEELALIEDVARHVGEFLFVLNKSDRVADQDSAEAAAFTARTIAAQLERDVDRVFRVSAAERVAGLVTRDWAQLEEALSGLAGRSGTVLHAAAARGAKRISAALLREIAGQRDALVRPLEQSEQRLRLLRGAIAEGELSLRELSARLKVEHIALAERFGQAREAFVARAVPEAIEQLRTEVARVPPRAGPATRTAAVDVARTIAKERVAGWAEAVQPQAEALYGATMKRFVEMANDFIRRISHGLATDAGLEAGDISGEQAFRDPGRFYFTSMMALGDPGFWTWLLDWVRPHRYRVASSARYASSYMERLIRSNASRVANDLSSRVEQSQRRLEHEIRERLSDLVATAERALDKARTRQAAGEDAVRAEVTRLDGLRRRVGDCAW